MAIPTTKCKLPLPLIPLPPLPPLPQLPELPELPVIVLKLKCPLD